MDLLIDQQLQEALEVVDDGMSMRKVANI